MKQILVGRQQEQAILEKAFHSNKREMVSVFGRRWVVNSHFKPAMIPAKQV